jgi:CelD/BcsL family acetyltransferase involved in cellulose biosynthesis
MYLFFVSPKARGQGIGPALLSRFCSEMPGFDGCLLTVAEDNLPSRKATEKAGFRPLMRGPDDITYLRRLTAAPETTVEWTDRLDPLREDWDRLFERTPAASGFESFGWIQAFHEAFPRGELRIAVARRGGRVVGIVPMRLCAGRLSLIKSGNYAGPVYEPDSLEGLVGAWARAIRRERNVRAVDLDGLRGTSPFFERVSGLSLGRWGPPRVVRTFTCPAVELGGSVLERRSGRTRSSLSRRWRRLEQQGRLEFVETSDPDAIKARLPRLFELYERRWEGRPIRGGFTRPMQDFHAKALTAGCSRLSTLELNGDVIAFSYGVRAGGVTTSYTLAHDSGFDAFSPGRLLLVRILEAAAARGDRAYDFSLGDAPYKQEWADHDQGVYRLLWGRHNHGLGAVERLRAGARSCPWLAWLGRFILTGPIFLP